MYQLKEVDFVVNNEADLMQALLKGYVVEDNIGGRYKLIDGNMHFSNYEIYTSCNIPLKAIVKGLVFIYEEIIPPWYENIPDIGVLCYCWDTEHPQKRLYIVTNYDREEQYPFIVESGCSYSHAEPLTTKDLEKYLEIAREIEKNV